jgi:hypothetical protein
MSFRSNRKAGMTQITLAETMGPRGSCSGNVALIEWACTANTRTAQNDRTTGSLFARQN